MGGANNPGPLSQQNYDWGLNMGLEFTYKSSPKIELIMDLGYNSIEEKDNYENPKESYGSLTAGVRFNMNESQTTSFIEFSGGLYSFSFRNYSIITSEYYNDNKDYAGFNAGTGIKIGLTSLIDAIAKTNLNFLLSEKYAHVPNYLTFHGGLRFNL
jgi:hypothetical protein